jgi:hypothetical protein
MGHSDRRVFQPAMVVDRTNRLDRIVLESAGEMFYGRKSKQMQGQWDFTRLSEVTRLEPVLSKPTFPWSVEGLSRNKYLTVEFIKAFNRLHLGSSLNDWHWGDISTVIDPIQVLTYPNLPWRRRELSSNNRLTVDTLKRLDRLFAIGERSDETSHASDTWDWSAISLRAKMIDVMLHPDLPWVRGAPQQAPVMGVLPSEPAGLSANPHLTVDVIFQLGDRHPDWDWGWISQKIDINQILDHPYLPWQGDRVLLNPGYNSRIGFALEDDIDLGNEDGVSDEEVAVLKKNPRLVQDWDRTLLSHNPEITLDFMLWFDGNDSTERSEDEWADSQHGRNQAVDEDTMWDNYLQITPELGWDLTYLTKVLSIGELIEGRFQYEWNPTVLAHRPDFIEMIRAEPAWVLNKIVFGPLSSSGTTVRDVYRQPHLPWSREAISGISDLTPDDIRRLDLLSGSESTPTLPEPFLLNRSQTSASSDVDLQRRRS